MKQEKGYTEMKDSGVEWISQIPTDWQVKRLKEQFSFGKGLPITKADLVDSGVAVISYGQIHAKSNTGTHLAESLLRYVPKTFLETNPSAILRKGDIVLADTSEDLDGIGNAALMDIDETVFAGYHTIILHPSKADFSKYLSYLFQTDNWRSQLRANASGIKVFSVTQKMLRSCSFILPPKSVRDAITTYLDTQCAKIDEIIAQAKASIEDYKQWKASIIYEAVTKGLDPNVELKESGVPWIGKMPVNWTISALKNLCTMQAGKNLTSEQISTSGRYPVYGGNGQRGYYSAYNADGHFLLIGRQGALCGNVHDVSGKFWATEHAVVTSATKVTNICYLYYLLIAMNLNQYASNSAAQPGLSVGNILNLKTLLPPLDEQARVSKFLDDFCSKIDVILTEKQSLIDDLESYKKSLIYEVVTGKRQVCK